MVPGAAGSARGRRSLRLERADRLRKRFEFGRVRDQGRRVHTKSFVLLLRKNELNRQRLGLTVSTKVGCAVRRNRVKRLVRELFRQHRELFPASVDLVVIAKAGCDVDSLRDVHAQFAQAARAMAATLQDPSASGRSPSAGPARKGSAPRTRPHDGGKP